MTDLGVEEPEVGGLRFVRERRIADKVVLVNGFTGTGKTMLAPIMGSLNRVELMRFNYHLENALQLHYMGALSTNAAENLIKMWTDLDIYRSMMGRETNFRYPDLSGAAINSQVIKYIPVLFTVMVK